MAQAIDWPVNFQALHAWPRAALHGTVFDLEAAMKTSSYGLYIAGSLLVLLANDSGAAEPLGFSVKFDTVMEHDDGKFLWFHPRVAAIPKAGRDGQPTVVMTLQKHLHTSDHYSGLYFMRSDDLGAAWTKPEMPPELDWRKESDKVDIAVADVTPIWHAPSGKVLAVGAEVRYSK